MAGSCRPPEAIKHLPNSLKKLLPSDIPALILELLEELVDAFVGVHVLLPRREENSQQCRLKAGRLET